MKKIKHLLYLFLFLCVGGGNAFAQDMVTVSGVVTSADTKEPLIGATVIASPTNGVTTLGDGSYTIKAAPGTRLTFQYMGYQAYWYKVPEGTSSVNHNVQLMLDIQSVEDVVVVAYGVRKKGTIAGSVSTVKADKLENVPAASFDQALQGQSPGLTVLSNKGEPSAAATFQIRGMNSINSGTSPLFILDGLPISSADFNAISPYDIESVSVLKDASSTSIYGARAANGVIVITTKRGKMAEKAMITFRTQLGFSQLARGNWNLMNTAERIQYEKEVGLTDGKDYDRLSKINVNWRDEVFNKFAPLQNYELQVSGANERINYYVSGGFFDQDGTTSDSDFRRYNLRTNFEARANNWLKVGANIMLTYEEYAETVSGEEYYMNTPIAATRFMLPYWDPYKSDGTLASVSDGSWKGSGENPLEWAKNNPYETKKYKVITSLFAEVRPIKDLVIRSQGGIDYSHGTVFNISYPSYGPNNQQGMAGRSSSDAFNFTITNTANYNFDINRLHRFNVMLGQEGVNYMVEGFSIRSSGQNNDLLKDVSFGTRANTWSSTSNSYAYLSFFGRGEYNYDDRYYADFSVRGDGSSRFGKDNRWAGFWSLGLMWNARNEKFLENSRSWLTNAQLAFSIGTSGNSSIPNYDHLALVGGGSDYMGNAGIAPYSQGNPHLKWEKVLTTNLALHLGFWNRLNVDLELYNKKTSNMLMSVPISYAAGGFGYRWDNVGGMINRGAELSLGATVYRNKEFAWNVSANVSYNHNEITELYNGLDEAVIGSSGTKLKVGHSYGEFFLNRFAGVNPANGDPLWYDKDGQITTEFRESDKVMIGKSFIAPWQGGFGTTLSWKGLMLSAQFSWVADRWMMNNDRFFEEGGGVFDTYNQSKRMLYDRWKEPGDITDIPRHGVTPQFDTRLLENASFLRLKNLMISYSFPQTLLEKTRFIDGAMVYVQAQNLLTFTGFTGLDPESSSNVYRAQYPMSRQFTFGLELKF